MSFRLERVEYMPKVLEPNVLHVSVSFGIIFAPAVAA